MVQRSFDSADFFASEEICCAQDDKGTGFRLWAFGFRVWALGKETPAYGVKATRLKQIARVDHLCRSTLASAHQSRQSDSEQRLSRFHNKPSSRDYNETFTAMLTPGCWRL
jgi:hypothetical protein